MCGPKPQGEYGRNRLQLKEATVLMTDPASTTTTVSSTTSTTVQSASVSLYTNVLSRNYLKIKKESSNVLAQSTPAPK